MERIRSYLLLFLVFAVLCTVCTSCVMPRNAMDYREFGFSAELSWQSQGLTARAQIQVEPPTESPSAPRNFSLCFSSPDSLNGILLTRTEEGLRVDCNGLSADASILSPLLSHAELLLPTGILEVLCDTTLNGEKVLYAEIKSEPKRESNEGEDEKEENEQKTQVYELYLEPSTGIPRRICYGSLILDISSFAFLS